MDWQDKLQVEPEINLFNSSFACVSTLKGKTY